MVLVWLPCNRRKYFHRFSVGILSYQAMYSRLFDTQRYIGGNGSKLIADEVNK